MVLMCLVMPYTAGMKFTTSLRVRYAETDQMGVVYHGNYFAWFEVGRVELLRSLGFTYADLERQEGCNLPVVEVNCRYRKPAFYDDLLTIETHVKALRGPIMVFEYAVRRGEELLAEGESKHVSVDKSMKPRKLPKTYQDAMLASMDTPSGS